MFNIKNRTQIFAFAVLACQIASAADKGWTGGNPNRVMPTPEKEIWRAPFNSGMDAFRVDWRDGATGCVSVVGGALRIEKVNAKGMVVVTAAENNRKSHSIPDTHPEGKYQYAEKQLFRCLF